MHSYHSPKSGYQCLCQTYINLLINILQINYFNYYLFRTRYSSNRPNGVFRALYFTLTNQRFKKLTKAIEERLWFGVEATTAHYSNDGCGF